MLHMMIRKVLPIFIMLIVLLASGCAHKYSEAQYKAVVSREKDCADKLQKMKDESDSSSKNSSVIQKKLDQTSQELAKALMEKQELLDKNIQCLEEKKILIKQISQSSSLSQEKKEAQQRMNKDFEYIMSLLEGERLSDQIYIIKAQDRIKIVLPQRSLFPTPGSAWLTPKGTKLVNKVAAGLKHLSPSSIEIAGHTDNSYVSDVKGSTYPSNWHLALARAISVLQAMEEIHVKRDTMYASAFGDTRPIADASTEAGKAMNRRVEIIFTP
jgi:chemotaxis protein MotB